MEVDGIARERLRPLRRSEYERLAESGLFGKERIELLNGFLVRMSPQGSRHANVIRLLTRLLVRAVGDRALVDVQLPLALSDDSEPEPDIAVVRSRSYRDAHPRSAWLVIEVSDRSANLDRSVKARLYAEAGIPELWIVDVEARAIEVRSKPRGGKYTARRVVRRGELRSKVVPGATLVVGVADLFA